MGYTTVLLLSVFVANAVAGPLKYSDGQCARHCTENNKLRYEPGVYLHDYESDTITTIQGTTHEESRVHMKAKVMIEVISKCELVMRLRETSLENSDPRNPNARTATRNSREFAEAMQRYDLRFSFQDGIIDNICPTEDEEPWVLNIKRGILSTLQNSMDNLETSQTVSETDVAGRCTSEYTSLGRNWRNVYTVRKSKDLMSCKDRSNIQTALQGSPYTEQQSKSLPLIKGIQVCEQKFSSNILQSVSCTESHIFRPFSKQSNGAVTRTVQKLTFNSKHNSRFAGNDYRLVNENLLFNHNYEKTEDGARQQEAEQLLSVLCNAAKEEIRSDVPRLFTQFVYKLKTLQHSELMAVNNRVGRICPDNNRGRKFFTDALATIGTSASVRLMKEMIERNEVASTEAEIWMTSLAFITNPTVDMINTLTPLLDGKYEQALLGISGLIHTFCRSKTECGRIPEVRRAVRMLINNLGENCYSSESRKVLLSLKAIGNIGEGEETQRILQQCYHNPQLSTETRLAAIQAFRRFSCYVPRDDLLQLYSNYKEDSELRIASYLAVMRCANHYTMDIIKNTLENEIVNQVGSFVWTHLTNIRESENPVKREIKEIVTNLYLMNKYNTDIRKFSRAMEGSMFFDSINVGAHAESNIIYSPQSYVPRSAMFNLTVDVLGSTVNLFEIGGRLEHVEKIIERLFGPKGYFSQSSVSKVVNNWRQKRSISDNRVEEMSDKFDAKTRFNEDPFGSMYLKIFGNEMWYSNLDFLRSQRESFDLNNFLRELAREQDVEFSKSFMFLDATYTIPTGNGFPLRLAINGTASVGLKVGGKFDVRSLKQVDIRGRFQPSGAVEISSLMTVDAGTARSGLKMIATLHSSTWMDGLVEIRNGQVMKVQLNVPKDRMDIIDVQSRIFLLNGETEKEQKGPQERSKILSSCSGRYTNKLLGMELCSQVQLPENGDNRNLPLFPMSGAAVARVYLRKTDRTLTSFNFEAKWNKETDKNGESIRSAFVTLNTPRSSVDRELTLDFQLNEPEKSLSLKLKTPIKKLGLAARYTNEDVQKRFDVRFTVDDLEKFVIQSSLRSDTNSAGGLYSPALEIIGPNGRLVAITGSAHIRHGERYSGQLTIEDFTRKPISLNANLDIKERERYEIQMAVSSSYIESNIQGFAQLADSISSKLTMDYQFEQQRRETIDIIAKFRDLSASSLTKYAGTFSLLSTAMPQYTTAATWEMQHTTGHMENTLQINLGDGRRSRMHKITLQEIIRYQGSLSNNNAALVLKMVYPEKNIDFTFDMKHENTDKYLSNKLVVQYAPNKQVKMDTELNLEPNQFKGGVKLQYPGRESRLSVNAVRNNNEYRAGMIAQWQRGRQLTAQANFKNIKEGNQIRYEGDAEVSLSNRKPIGTSIAVGIVDSQYSFLGSAYIGKQKYSINGNFVNSGQFNKRMDAFINIPGETYSAEATLQEERNNIIGNIDFKSNSRHVIGRLRTTNSRNAKSGSLEVLMDAERDPRNSFVIEGQLSTGNKYQGTLNVRSPGYNIQGVIASTHQGNILEGIFKTNHHIEFEWQPRRKVTADLTVDSNLKNSRRQLSGTLSLNTPFDHFEDYSLSFNHNDNGQEWRTESNIKLYRGRAITGFTQGRYSSDRYGQSFNAKLRINTPYSNYERINADVNYNTASNEFNILTKTEWGLDKNVGFGASTRYVPNSDYRASFNFTSNYERARMMISSNVALTKSNEGYRAQIDSQWAEDQKVTVLIDGKQKYDGYKRICDVVMQGSTPFRGYENLYSKLTYTNDGNSASIDSESTWGYNKMSGGISGSIKSNSNNNNLEGKIYFNTPFKNFENFQVTATHFNEQQRFKSFIEIQLPRNPRTITLRGQGKWSSINDVELNLLMTSPFNNFERISAEIVHRINGNNLRTIGEVQYGNYKMTGELTGTHSSSRRSYNTEIYFQGITPFKGYEEIKASIVNNRREYNFLTILQLTFNQDNSKLQNKLRMDNILNFEEDLQITSPYIKNIVVNVKQEYANGNFKYILDARQGRERLRVEGEYVNRSPNYGANVELNVKANTPFETLRSLNIEGTYDSNGRSYTPKMTVQWNGPNKIVIEGNLLNNRYKRMELRGSFTSPFSGFEYFSVSGNYDITTQKKTMELNLQWDVRENKQITSKGFVFGDRNGGQLELTVKTPEQDYSLNGNYVLNSREKSANLEYQYGWRKITLKTKNVISNDGSEMEVIFTSPYKSVEKLILTEGHAFGDNIINGQTSVQLNEKKIFLGGEFIRDGPRGSLRITFNSPFRGYEVVMVEVKGDLYSQRKTLDGFFEWDVNQKYQLSAVYEDTTRNIFNVVIRTPIRNYEELSFESQIQTDSGELRGQINVQCPRHKITADGLVRHNGVYPTEIIFTADSPFSPFKNVKFTQTITKQRGQFELNSNLEWENINKVDVYISTLNRNNRYMEAKAKINTPFKQFPSASIEGNIDNGNSETINGKLSVITPFKSIQNLELNGSYQKSANGFDALVTASNSDQKFSISGSYNNNNLNPLEVKLNINAPFASFRTFSVEGNLRKEGTAYLNGDLTVSTNKEKHFTSFRLRNNNGQLDGQVKFDSILIYWQRMSFEFQANYADYKNMDGNIKIFFGQDSISLTGSYRSGRRDMEAVLRLKSPRILIYDDEMVMKISYSTRRNRYDLKASIEEPSEIHTLEAFYSNDNREITSEFNLKSSMFSFKSFNARGKFINGNDRNMEVLASVFTPYSSHSLEGIIKNYDTEKDAQIKLTSPLFSFKTLTLTGSMRDDNSRSMDGSLTIATPSKELRISGNMKKITWNNFEAFVTINTPFDSLRVLRVDSKFLNDRNQNIEGNLEIQSSNDNMKRFGISGKYHHGQGVEELSVNLRLPSREYPAVGLLGTLHYVPGSFSPRITISLPGKRYSAFATYEHKYDETTAGFGYEWEREKVEINGHLKFNEEGMNAKLSLTTPFRDYENQEMSLVYNRERSRHNVALTYKNAKNEVVNIRGHLGYYNNMNFNVELNVATPYRGFEDIVFRMRQENRRNRFGTNVDFTWSRYKKVALTLEREYNNTHSSGYIYVTSPYEILRTMKMDYSIEDNYYNKIGNAQLEYNNKAMFKTEASSVYDRNTRNYNRNLMVNIPSVPLTISILFKPLTAGAESTIKTNYPSRSISLHTVYQLTKNHFNHGAELTWDEKMRRSLSYEMRLADVLTENDAKEFYGRLNLPIRSFEVLGKHTRLPNGRNVEMNLYWDVARDPQKHLNLKMEHEDQSNWKNTAHKLRVSVNHPRLSKDIVATAQVSSSNAEAFGKLELEYSRYQQHNMMLEGRLRNMARGSRDTNYVAYVTARHPISNTDLRMMGEMVNNDEEAAVNLRINYLDRQQRQRIEELKGKISKLREQIDLIAKSDNNQMSLTGRMFHMDNEYTLSLEEKVNDLPPVHSHARFSKRHMNMDLNITTPGQENLHVKAAMPNDAVHFEISHTENGRRMSDVLFNLGLKESRILKSRLTWRSQIWQNIKNAISDKYNEVSDVVIVKKDKIATELADELYAKKETINQAIRQELGPFREEMSRDMDKLRYDVEEVNNNLYAMYQNDEFYIQTATGKVGTVYEVISDYTDAGIQKTKQELEELKNYLAESYKKAVKYAGNYYRNTHRKLIRMYNRLNRQMYEMVDYVMENIQETLHDWAMIASIRLSQLAVYIMNNLQDFITKYAPWMETYYEHYKDMINNAFRNFVDALHENAYYQALQEYWIRLLNTLEEFFQQPFSERFERAVNYVGDNLIDYYETGKQFHEKYIREYYRRIYEHGSYLYRTLRLDVVVNALAEGTYQKAKTMLYDTARGLLNEYINVFKGTKYVFEPQNGKIVLEIPLPSPKGSLKEALDPTSYPEFQKLAEFKDTYLSSEDYCIWDTYYKYKHYLEQSLKVPPFDTYAMLAGNQHFITFDKTHFDFLGECSYLLARDFVDGNFTVIVNYAQVGRDPAIVMKSLTILSNDKKIDIGSDYKITVDDTKVELPQLLDDTLITREESVVVVENAKGLLVRCNFIHNLCTVHISGFYFGKTAGLFGTYDYEPKLDMMTPDRRLENNVEAFANSWEVSNTACRRSNMATIISNDYRVQETCKNLFDNKDSIFRPCYKQVDPTNFYNMCLRDLARYAPNMFEEKICTSAAAYMTECNMAGVPVRMPKSCVRCEKHDGNIMNEGDVIKITNYEPVQSADVVFIVEKKPCNKDHVRMLSKLAQDIESSLTQKEYRNIKYAVVGFGGQKIQQPHLQTSDGKEFVDVRSIDSAFSFLVNDWSDDDKQTNSVFEAIRYAAALPFRTGSAKTFVLLKCSSCKAEDVKADYSEMLRTLLDGDVVLHLLMEHEFEMKNNKSKGKRMLGIDKKVVYTLKDWKDPLLRGDRDLLAQLKIPKDFCVPLALEVNGSLFDSHILRETKRNMNKKFIDVFSRRLAKTATPSECQVCECISTADGIGKSICQRCVSPIIADMISPYISPMISSYDNYDDDEISSDLVRQLQDPLNQEKSR